MHRNKDNLWALFLAAAVAFLYLSGIPAALLIHIEWADVDPVCITLLINIIITMLLAICMVHVLIPKFFLGFQRDGFGQGLRKYGVSCILAFAVPCCAFAIGLFPFNYTPTVQKVLVEGIIYYIGVGVIEEFFCRGLLQNAIKNTFKQSRHAELIAVLGASLIFGAGHIFGMIGMPLHLIACKLAWAVGLGVYLGAIYAKTKNLWLAAFFHFVIDLCGLPFCFSTQKIYPTTSSIVVLIVFVLLGIYGIRLLKTTDSEHDQTQCRT